MCAVCNRLVSQIEICTISEKKNRNRFRKDNEIFALNTYTYSDLHEPVAAAAAALEVAQHYLKRRKYSLYYPDTE